MDVMIDISQTVLETERLILRTWKETDINDFYEYASVDGVGEMAGWIHHENINESKCILKRFIADKKTYAVVYKGNNKVIGSIGLEYSWANRDSEYKDRKVKEIGYVLSKNYWGKGLMPEAVKEVIKYCFNEFHLEALTICHFSTNNQSKSVIKKCGFQYVKQSTYFAKQLQKEVVSLHYIMYH